MGIAGRDVPVGIIGAIMQRYVACVRMKDRDNLRLGLPLSDVM